MAKTISPPREVESVKPSESESNLPHKMFDMPMIEKIEKLEEMKKRRLRFMKKQKSDETVFSFFFGKPKSLGRRSSLVNTPL